MDIDLYSQMQFNKAQSNCVSEALSALPGLSEEEIKNFINDVFSEAHEKEIPVAKAVENQVGGLKSTLANTLYRLNKIYELLFSPTGWFNLIKEGKLKINDVLSKNSTKNPSGNIEVKQEHMVVKLRQLLLGRLSTKAQDMFMSGEHDKAIGEYLTNGRVPKDQTEIRDIGDSVKNSVEQNRFELVDSTAMDVKGLNKYRQWGASYDPMKVSLEPKFKSIINLFKRGDSISRGESGEAKKTFIAKMMDRSNLKVMFGKDWKNAAVVKDSFGEMYDNIIRGGKIIKTERTNIKNEPDVAKRQRMFVVWKDWGSYVDHIQDYGVGRGTLFEQAMSEIHKVGRSSGLARVLGPDATWAFDQLRDASIKATGREKFWANPVNIFANLTGAANVPQSPALARMSSEYMAYTGMVKQPLLTLLSLNDTNFGLQTITDITRTSYWQNFATKLRTIGEVYKSQLTQGEPSPDTTRMLNNMYHSLRFEQGAHSRFIDANNLGDITRKISATFYKVIGMSGKDVGNRASAMSLVSKALADEKGSSLADLETKNPGMHKRLQAYNISSDEWDLLRSNITKEPFSKQELVGIETIQDIPDEQFKVLATKLGKSQTEVKDALSTKVFAWLNTAADETVLTPGAMEHAMVNFGVQPGTPLGTLLRAFGHFKGFLLSYANRILINGFKNDPSKMKWHWAISNFVYTLPITLASNAMYNAAHGRPLKLDPLEWDLDDWGENLLPGIAMFSKVLSPRDEDSSLILHLLQSPSLSATSDLLSTIFSGINLARPSTGDAHKRLERFKSKSGKVVYDFTPINSIPYLSPWWKHNMISTKP